MLDRMIVTENNVYYRVHDNQYLTIENMLNVCLYKEIDKQETLIRRKSLSVTEYKELLTTGTSEDQLDFLYYELSDVTGEDISEDILEVFASVLFDTRIFCAVDTGGPYIKFGDCYVSLGEGNILQLKDSKTGQLLGKPFNSDIYTVVGSSAVPREVTRVIIKRMLFSTNNSGYQKYILYTDVMNEFSDYIKAVTDTPISKEKQQEFEEKVLPNDTPIDEVQITFKNGSLEINNNGKIIVIEGGDGLALSTKDGILTVSTKGLKKDTINAKTFEEAMQKVSTKTLEVLRPCGSKAVSLFKTKIKPEMVKLTKEVAKQSGAALESLSEKGKSLKEKQVEEKNSPRSFRNKENAYREEDYEDDEPIPKPKKIKPSKKATVPHATQGNEESPMVLYLTVGVMLLAIFLVALGGCGK